jgi:hypothetical protein
VFAHVGIQTGVGQHQTLDRFTTDDVRFNNLIHVGLGDVSIPDGIWIDHEIRSVLALIETARLVGADLALEATFRQFLLEEFLQHRLAGGIAASPRTSRRTPVAADENVFFELGHEEGSVSQRLIGKFFEGRGAWVPLSQRVDMENFFQRCPPAFGALTVYPSGDLFARSHGRLHGVASLALPFVE